jgi:hypothetical protein
MSVLIARWFPPVKITHPFPWERFEAKNPM